MRLSAYRALADSASAINYRARGSEIKMIATVNVSELQKQQIQYLRRFVH